MATESEKRVLSFVSLATSVVEDVLIKDAGIQPELAATIADKAVRAIMDTLGRGSLYVPAGIARRLQERDRAMFLRYTGNNAHALAKEANISLVRFYQIMQIQRAMWQTETQRNLPGLDD